jgi:hypothetical protein
MTSGRVTFARGSCLIEIEQHEHAEAGTRFVARMSVVEEAGAIVRPIVGPDGKRIKIITTNAHLARRVALSYLEGRFGRQLQPDPTGSLGAATVGVPFVAR